jgi:hypothetical protein
VLGRPSGVALVAITGALLVTAFWLTRSPRAEPRANTPRSSLPTAGRAPAPAQQPSLEPRSIDAVAPTAAAAEQEAARPLKTLMAAEYPSAQARTDAYVAELERGGPASDTWKLADVLAQTSPSLRPRLDSLHCYADGCTLRTTCREARDCAGLDDAVPADVLNEMNMVDGILYRSPVEDTAAGHRVTWILFRGGFR